MTDRRVLGVFARAPVPGTVKSRLAAALGAERACALYRAFLEDTLAAAAVAARMQGARLELVVAGPLDHPVVRAGAARHGAELVAQAEGDLGARLGAFFAAQGAGGAAVCVVGSDAPQLSGAQLARGFDALVAHEVVLGPSRDGGYWLIGARRPISELFVDVPWSTPRVLELSLDRLAGRSVALLEMSFDVDGVEDLALLRRWLAVSRAEVAPSTRAAMVAAEVG
jgi:rSAM/selenodomain-associated transferase 1